MAIWGACICPASGVQYGLGLRPLSSLTPRHVAAATTMCTNWSKCDADQMVCLRDCVVAVWECGTLRAAAPIGRVALPATRRDISPGKLQVVAGIAVTRRDVLVRRVLADGRAVRVTFGNVREARVLGQARRAWRRRVGVFALVRIGDGERNDRVLLNPRLGSGPLKPLRARGLGITEAFRGGGGFLVRAVLGAEPRLDAIERGEELPRSTAASIAVNCNQLQSLTVTYSQLQSATVEMSGAARVRVVCAVRRPGR